MADRCMESSDDGAGSNAAGVDGQPTQEGHSAGPTNLIPDQAGLAENRESQLRAQQDSEQDQRDDGEAISVTGNQEVPRSGWLGAGDAVDRGSAGNCAR